MNITFSRKEFTRLIELAYMGEWVATASLGDDGQAFSSAGKRYGPLMRKLYKLAAENEDGCPEYVGESEDGLPGEEFVPSYRLEEESPASKALDRFENSTFWDELITRLAERDHERKRLRESQPASLPGGDADDEIREILRLEGKYRDEFVKNDLANLFVMFGSDRLS